MYKKLIYLALIVTYSPLAFSQGAWNISYLSIHVVDSSLVGKDVRIDFKASDADSVHDSVSGLEIRKLLATKDTVSLTLNNKPIKFMEHWQLYVDHGVLADQYVEGISTNKTEKIYLKEMILESINQDTLTILATVYGTNNSKYKQKIVVPRSIVKGLLVATE
jgi:hypothetical protein